MESTPATTMAETAATAPAVNRAAAVAAVAAATTGAAEGGRDVVSPALPVASLPEGPGSEAARAAPRAKVLNSADVVRGRSGAWTPTMQAPPPKPTLATNQIRLHHSP